jgi:hypothetical protein
VKESKRKLAQIVNVDKNTISELSYNLGQLKIQSVDKKYYQTDVVDME